MSAVQRRQRRDRILPYLSLVLLVNILAGVLLGGHFLANRSMHWDNLKLYSVFRDNNYSLNHFGEVMWWNPSDNMGFPSFYFSHLGTNTFTPLGAATLTCSWLLGKAGIVVRDYTIPYIIYFTFAVPLLFSTAFFLLAYQVFRNRYVRVFVIILAAFSPGVVFNLSDNGLEEIAYALFFAAALLNYYRRPQRKNFYWLVAASGMIAISFNHLALYCSLAFLVLFVAGLFLIQKDRRFVVQRARQFFRGVPWYFWAGGGAVVLGCLLPALLSYRQGGDILRARNLERWYSFEYLRPGNPIELLTVGTPGIAFEWFPDYDAPGAKWSIRGYGECRVPAYTYMGIMTLPLAFVGLCFGRKPWRWRLLLLTAAMSLVVVFQGWSSVFAAILVWPSPLRACNHFNDTIFRTSVFLLMIFNAAMGLESVMASRRLHRCALPIALGISTVLSGLLLAVVHGRGLLNDSLFGFFAAASTITLIAVVSSAVCKPERRRRQALLAILILAALDLSTVSFWHVRTFMWNAPKALSDPPPGGIGMPYDLRSMYARSVLVLRQMHRVYSAGIGPEQLAAIPPLALFDRAVLLTPEQGRTFDYTRLNSLVLSPDEPLSASLSEFCDASRPGRASPPVGRVVKQTYNRLQLDLRVDRPQILFWKDTYFPGWKATVNGVPETIVPAFWCFKAIKVPAGNVKITFQFSQPLLLFTLVLGYLTLVGCFVAGCFGRRLRAKPLQPGRASRR